MLTTLIVCFLAGIVALAVLGLGIAVVTAVVGVTLTLFGLLVVKLLPVLLIGYVLMRFLAPRRSPRDPLLPGGLD